MSIGSFILIRNEELWIRDHLISWLPYLDEMVFFDGNSTDSTLETIEGLKENSKLGYKIKLHKNKNPVNFQEDYVNLFNEALHSLTTDFAFFLHPDMFPISGVEKLKDLKDGLAFSTTIDSYAGDPGGQLFYLEGRATSWKNIMRLKNPDLGLHYFGYYGSSNEDMYFSEITGLSHDFFGSDFSHYPYQVLDSGLRIAHFSDVRNKERRIQRMERSLINQGYSEKEAANIARNHPRVNFISNHLLKFVPCKDPRVTHVAA